MNFTVLSCSLDPASRSRKLAREAERLLGERGHSTNFIDLQSSHLPQFDNLTAFGHENLEAIHRAIDTSDGVLIATPIYNWGLGSAAKNLIEITGATGVDGTRAAWFDKVVTFLCAGGLPHSYMAYGPVALSLMLDFKCIINPYAVYATERDFADDGGLISKISARLDKTITVKIELSEALKHRKYRSDWEV